MAVTVPEVMAILQGVVKDALTYYVFGHEILVSAVTAIISDVTVYNNDYWPATTLSTRATLVDLLIKYESAMEVMSIPTMGQQMISGVTYSTLQLSVSKGAAFTDQVEKVKVSLDLRRDKIRRMLQDGADTDMDDGIGEDYWTDGLERYDVDTTPTI